MDYLRNNFNHPNVDEVFEAVRDRLPRISKKTVYSNLHFLSEQGVIKELKIQGVLRYEPIENPHFHLVCRQCNSLVDLSSPELLELTAKVVRRVRNFTVESSEVNFYGLCKDCKEE